MTEFQEEDIKFHHPYRLILSGPSFSGKSWFIRSFLRNLDRVSDAKFDKIIFMYSTDQPLYREMAKEMPDIIWIRGYPEDLVEKHLSTPSEKKLLIADDLMQSLAQNKAFTQFMTCHSHHLNTSCLAVLQNLL